MAVQASEFYEKNVSVYDFVIAIIDSQNFGIVHLINDEEVSNYKQLEWNPHEQLIVCYEVN